MIWIKVKIPLGIDARKHNESVFSLFSEKFTSDGEFQTKECGLATKIISFLLYVAYENEKQNLMQRARGNNAFSLMFGAMRVAMKMKENKRKDQSACERKEGKIICFPICRPLFP